MAASSSSASLEQRMVAYIATLPDVLNDMVASGLLVMLRGGKGGHELRWKVAGAREQRLKGLSVEDTLVYQHIQKAGTSGVWTKDLKIRTNLPQAQITKILKGLEAKSLIKSIKSVANPSRKLVMLHELEPSKEVTGGAWYNTSQQFDENFIEVLRSALLRYLDRVTEAKLGPITKWLASSGILKNVDLGEDDVRQVLDSLQFEGKVDQFGEDGEELYRLAAERFPATTALTSLPCGRCPVIDQCRDGGPISPQTCVYFEKWLGF